ncbi:hypothetical protein GmHk_13G039135 [Glycine max]|nr:hypothetical protein GmHk_13G039135 [Glycine max]
MMYGAFQELSIKRGIPSRSSYSLSYCWLQREILLVSVGIGVACSGYCSITLMSMQLHNALSH